MYALEGEPYQIYTGSSTVASITRMSSLADILTGETIHMHVKGRRESTRRQAIVSHNEHNTAGCDDP